MPELNYFANREALIEKTFIVRVAYPKDFKPEYITTFSIYNALCGGKNFVECEAKEVSEIRVGKSKALLVREI